MTAAEPPTGPDAELRRISWRALCPDITDGEVDALETLPEARHPRSDPAQLLAAYRAGERAALLGLGDPR
jgi:hypothetical protein